VAIKFFSNVAFGSGCAKARRIREPVAASEFVILSPDAVPRFVARGPVPAAEVGRILKVVAKDPYGTAHREAVEAEVRALRESVAAARAAAGTPAASGAEDRLRAARAKASLPVPTADPREEKRRARAFADLRELLDRVLARAETRDAAEADRLAAAEIVSLVERGRSRDAADRSRDLVWDLYPESAACGLARDLIVATDAVAPEVADLRAPDLEAERRRLREEASAILEPGAATTPDR
jgi:hypothetical protein